MKVTREQIQQARRVNLFDFLRSHHGDEIEVDRNGKTLRLKTNHSVSVKSDYSGYMDFATGEKGNGIDILTRHFGYDFTSAVLALCGCSSNFSSFSSKNTGITGVKKEKNQSIQLPAPAQDYRRLMAYLTKTRKIPAYIIQPIIDKGLLYQAEGTNNAVFVSAKKDFAELRGTLTDRTYHGIVAGSRHDGCWAFSLGQNPNSAFICESAIDALSLATILGEVAYYISIAGASKQASIDRIKQSKLEVIIATDNDQAGDTCRHRNQDCQTIVPNGKDWNEDLQNIS